MLPKIPALGRLRLACVEDAPIAMQFVNDAMAMTFRIETTSDIVYLMLVPLKSRFIMISDGLVWVFTDEGIVHERQIVRQALSSFYSVTVSTLLQL